MLFHDGSYKETIREHFLSALKEMKNNIDFVKFAMYEQELFPEDFSLFRMVVKNNFPEFLPLLDNLYKYSSIV